MIEETIAGLIAAVVGCMMPFLGGMWVGSVLVEHGYKMGFKASYEIRKAAGEDTDKGLFPTDNDPAEFDLLKEDKGVT